MSLRKEVYNNTNERRLTGPNVSKKGLNVFLSGNSSHTNGQSPVLDVECPNLRLTRQFVDVTALKMS